jgi:hypothetical protein
MPRASGIRVTASAIGFGSISASYGCHFSARKGANDMIEIPSVAQAGKLYFGFTCKNVDCALPIFVGEILPEQLDAAGGIQIASSHLEHEITCQQCGHKAVYRPDELQRFQVLAKEKLH